MEHFYQAKQPTGHAEQSRNRVIAFMTPDKSGMYFYLNKTMEEAVAAFKGHEDWIHLYEPDYGTPDKMEVHDIAFDDEFCLFNIRNDLERMFTDLGFGHLLGPRGEK